MKNMKRFSAVVGAAALVAVAFTGCNNNFAGTELNYSEVEAAKDATSTNKAGDRETRTSATVSAVQTNGVGSTGKASSRTSFTVTVTNNATNTRVNLASAKDAIDFYAVSNGSATTFKPRSTKLTKTLFSEKETDNKTAVFEFEVDTASIPTSDIAFFVDATKLKDKQGTLILNEDNNYKRGEATDSHLEYKTVDGSKSAPTGLDEELRPTWNPISGNPQVVALRNTSDNKFTGEFEVQVTPNPYKKNAITDTPAENKDMASTLNTIYALRTREPGATSTSTKSLSFSWNETKGKYIASAGNLVPGTYYDVVITKKDVSSLAPTWYTTAYGHPAFISDTAFGSKVNAATGTASVFLNTPDYIVEGYSTVSTTWNPDEFSDTAITNAQKSFVTVNQSGRTYTVTLNGTLEFETYNDFIVVNTYTSGTDTVEAKLPVTVKVKKNDADATNPDRVYKLEIEINNKNVDLTGAKLYVGNGVTLKSNPRNSTQKKFGTYKNAAEGVASGYVALN